MRLASFDFLADQNVQSVVVEWLRSIGNRVVAVREGELRGSPDDRLVEFARQHDLVVLTHDSDFGRLAIVNALVAPGIVFVRPGHIDASFTIATLKTLFEQCPELVTPFVVVASRTGDRVTIRATGDVSSACATSPR